jgi:large subunit ribosomal protein L4
MFVRLLRRPEYGTPRNDNNIFMSIKIKIYNQNAEAVGEMDLAPEVFGVPASLPLIHQAVITQMANERKVIAHTKTRSEVRGGGRKPWKQKGTGRARHGSSRSPIWIGGGVTFGPRNDRNFKMRINKKMKRGAMSMVLSDKAASGCLTVLDKLEMAEFKTKLFKGIINKLQPQTDKKTKRSVLIIIEKNEEKLNYSVRNLPGIELININNINIVGLLKYKNLLMTKAAVEKVSENLKVS